MTITLNGSSAETDATTVQTLLEELGLADKPVVIEHNETALLKTEHETTTLADGDSLEVITLAAGG